MVNQEVSMFNASRQVDCGFANSGVSEPRRRILVVDDHALVRLCIRNVCASLCEDVVVLEATSLAGALALYDQYRASIEFVVLALGLPDSKGFASLHKLRRQHPDSRILVLSGAFDKAVAAEACAQGARWVLPNGADAASLRMMLSEALEERCRSAAAGARRASRRRPAANALSSRKIEILDLVLRGATNEEITGRTGLKLGTVKNYITGLYAAFEASSRSALISLFA
jgi:DNA-binding NarL/FixJ family response regulator